jgi:aspartate racemase
VLIPDSEERAMVHRVIFDELCQGKVVDASRRDYARVIARLVEQGAEAILLGCTEISLLIGRQDCAVPLFDTTSLHARRAAEWALSGP